MLSEAPDRTLRMSQLAEQTTSSASRLSHAVARLEEKGWVRRDKHPTDRRGSLAVLTDDGWQAVRRGRARPRGRRARRCSSTGSLRARRPAAGDHRPAHRPALACAAWLSSSPRRTRPRRPRRRTPARARRTRARSRCAASRWSTAPPTSGCSTRSGPSDWVHSDPWRVLRIQSEFVEGFGALAELGRGRQRVRLGPGARRTSPEYALGMEVGRLLVEAGYAVITGGGPGAMEAANRGRLRGRRRLGRARHRAALRAGHERVGRRRRQLPLLLRPQDDVRQVRPGLHRAARRLRHLRRAVRGAGPGADQEGHLVPGRAARPRLLGRPGRLAAVHGAARRQDQRRATSTCSRSPTTRPRRCGSWRPPTRRRPGRRSRRQPDDEAARKGAE